LLSLLRRRGIFDTLGLHGFNELLKFLFAQRRFSQKGKSPADGQTIAKISKSSTSGLG
jgi:hypothetical protein